MLITQTKYEGSSRRYYNRFCIAKGDGYHKPFYPREEHFTNFDTMNTFILEF